MRTRLLCVLLGLLALHGGACGNLDEITTVHDLRVLAVSAEPAGFLVDLTNPGAGSAAELQATLTALVADPLAGGDMQVVTTAVGCPDYVDTITAATGQSSKLCPSPQASSQLPAVLQTVVIFGPDAPSSTPPVEAGGIEYHPTATFGLTPDQLGIFFSPTPTGDAQADQIIAYNRDFGLDAIVNMTFAVNGEQATAIKRVVYWPRLSADETPNHNPTLKAVELYAHRDPVTGDPVDLLMDVSPTVKLSAMDGLYVLPVPADDAIETNYLLRVRNTATKQIDTVTVDHELLTYQFFATAGTFSPAERQSEQSVIFTPSGGIAHTDSHWTAPGKVPASGVVTIWVVARDERAGVSWSSRTVNLVP
jgi:hypothetical protein